MRNKQAYQIPLQYRLVLPLLLGSTQLYDMVKTDSDRRVLLDVKYNLSKHTVFRFLKDYATDPDSERWVHDNDRWLAGMTAYEILDKTTGVNFQIRMFTSNREEQYVARDIHVYIDNNNQLLNDMERVYLCLVIDGINSIKKNLLNLKEQQNTLYQRNNIKGMY